MKIIPPYIPAASWPLVRRILMSYVKPLWRGMALGLSLMMVSSLTTGAMAKLMEPIIDKVLTAQDDTMLWPVAIAVFSVFFIRGIATYGHTVIMGEVGQRIVSNIQLDMFRHLIHADLAYFHGQPSGHLQSRFLADIAMIRQALIESLAGVGKNLFTLVILICVMFAQDWKLSIISLFVLPVLGIVVARLGKKLRRVSKSAQEETGELTALLGQAFQGSKHVKAYCTEDYETGRVGQIIERIHRLMYKTYKTAALSTPLGETLSGIAVVTIIVYGGYQVLAGLTTAGKLFSFITAFILAFEPMKKLTQLYNAMQRGLAAAERLFEVLDVQPAVCDKPGAVELRTANPDIRFNNVSFAYADGAEALRGVSFHAPAGKTIALVGQSGSGKTTALNLVPRFYDVTGGSITVDGQDIRDVTLKSLRGAMALVSQDVALFNDTIRNNIAYGTTGATQDEIEAAARNAAAHDFIMELSSGYDTQVGENGVKLSGGQRQRIAIARAMLRNAPILLLDEATSALDTQSERLVQMAIDKLQKGRTTIVIAHRLSTIMNADIIYVMHNGLIIESGTHAELVKSNGSYAHLYGMMLRETA